MCHTETRASSGVHTRCEQVAGESSEEHIVHARNRCSPVDPSDPWQCETSVQTPDRLYRHTTHASRAPTRRFATRGSHRALNTSRDDVCTCSRFACHARGHATHRHSPGRSSALVVPDPSVRLVDMDPSDQVVRPRSQSNTAVRTRARCTCTAHTPQEPLFASPTRAQ